MPIKSKSQSITTSIADFEQYEIISSVLSMLELAKVYQIIEKCGLEFPNEEWKISIIEIIKRYLVDSVFDEKVSTKSIEALLKRIEKTHGIMQHLKASCSPVEVETFCLLNRTALAYKLPIVTSINSRSQEKALIRAALQKLAIQEKRKPNNNGDAFTRFVWDLYGIYIDGGKVPSRGGDKTAEKPVIKGFSGNCLYPLLQYLKTLFIPIQYSKMPYSLQKRLSTSDQGIETAIRRII